MGNITKLGAIRYKTQKKGYMDSRHCYPFIKGKKGTGMPLMHIPFCFFLVLNDWEPNVCEPFLFIICECHLVYQ